MIARVAAAAVAAGLTLIGGLWVGGRGGVVEVPAGTDVTAVIAETPPWTTLRLGPGVHGPFTVTRPGAVVGAPGASVRGPIEVFAPDVHLADLRVVGGRTGILVRGVDGARIERVWVAGTELHGIEVSDGSAVVEACRIEGMTSPYAQGFEVRNSTGRPHTFVRGCHVSSGQEGIVSHVSRVHFLDNVVTGTTLRAIVVTEMSEGLVRGNEVRDVMGSGIYCGDMSRCEILDNTVAGVAVNPNGVKAQAGHAVVGFYHSVLRLTDNRFEGIGAPDPVRIALGTMEVDRFPLSIWPRGWRGAIPAVWVAGASIGGLALVRLAAGPLVRRRWRRTSRPPAFGSGVPRGLLWGLVAGFAVQSFHMLEHSVQVWQVYVADAEIRSGLAGQAVDTEWVHFTYNAAVLGFLIVVWSILRDLPDGTRPGRGGAAFLLAALVVQGYHLAEHAAKIVQHVSTAVDPAPGILGHRFGLVWFHFGINLAVYAGMAVALAGVLRAAVRWAPAGRVASRGELAPAPGRS